MKYNLTNPIEITKFDTRIKYLKEKQKIVELKECRVVRSIKQNSFLHVVITLYAISFGSTLYEAKIDLKRACGFMAYEKEGNKYLRETSKMDSKELTEFIEWIIEYAGVHGCHIPSAIEYLEQKIEIDNQIETHKRYL